MGLSENDDTPMSILMVTCSKTIGLGVSLFSEKYSKTNPTSAVFFFHSCQGKADVPSAADVFEPRDATAGCSPGGSL